MSLYDEYQEESQLLGTKPECPPPRDFPTLLTCDKRAVWSMTCCVSMLSGVLPLLSNVPPNVALDLSMSDKNGSRTASWTDRYTGRDERCRTFVRVE